MNYFNTQTQTRHTEAEIRSANPNTSFPYPFIPPTGYELVFPAPQPEHNSVIQRVQEALPVLTVKGHYEQSWEVVPKFVEYTDSEDVVHTVAEQEAQATASAQAAVMQATVTAFDTALTLHLDTTAKQRRYDNRITCMVRAGFAGPFQAEGIAFATWCDTCNAIAYEMLAAVQAGTTPMPESPAAFIATLPVMGWPV